MNQNKHIGPKIQCISNSIKQHLCKDGQDMNLTSTQMHVLRYLTLHKDDTIHQKDILNEFELSNATVSGIISRLEAKGFVSCEYSSEDCRCKRIMITQKAMDCHLAIQKNIKHLETQIIDGFTETEITMLHDLLDRMLNNLNS